MFRVPRFRMPGPGLLDRYISRLYLRVVGLSFVALLGLFYISTFIDASDKIFKGSATTGTVMQLLAYRTPQFVYFVIPIAALLSVLVTFGLLSRTSELTVMKACGISLYRAAAPVVLLSLVFSAALFALDQEILARANRRAGALDDQIRGRPPKTFNPLNRRWIIGNDGIYHYGAFDSRRATLTSLTVYRLVPGAWRLASQTYVSTAEFRGRWTGYKGWTQEFAAGPAKWRGVRGDAAPHRAAGLLRDRGNRHRRDDGRAAPQGDRRGAGRRLQLRAAGGRAAPEARVSVRHARDDAAGRPLRRHHRPPRRALRHRPRHHASRCRTG